MKSRGQLQILIALVLITIMVTARAAINRDYLPIQRDPAADVVIITSATERAVLSSLAYASHQQTGTQTAFATKLNQLLAALSASSYGTIITVEGTPSIVLAWPTGSGPPVNQTVSPVNGTTYADAILNINQTESSTAWGYNAHVTLTQTIAPESVTYAHSTLSLITITCAVNLILNGRQDIWGGSSIAVNGASQTAALQKNFGNGTVTISSTFQYAGPGQYSVVIQTVDLNQVLVISSINIYIQ
jgi:hypothetical protein